MSLEFSIWAPIISAMVGSVALVFAGSALLRVANLKQLNLRMEFNRRKNTVEIEFDKLMGLDDEANRSRTLRLSADGKSNSNEMASWKQFYQSRQVRIRKLVNQFFNIKQEGPVKLEQKINDLDLIEKEIQLMKEQFVKAILEDNNAKQKSASTDMISTGQIKHTYAPSTKLASEVQEKTKQIESRKLLPMYTD